MKNKSPLFPAGVVTVTSLLLGLQEDESFLNITFPLSDHIKQFFGGRGAGGGETSPNFLICSTKSVKKLCGS